LDNIPFIGKILLIINSLIIVFGEGYAELVRKWFQNLPSGPTRPRRTISCACLVKCAAYFSGVGPRDSILKY